MKITIYELLGMIKDNKAPQKIMFENKEWEWEETWYDYKIVHKRENEADWSLFADEMNEYYDGVKDYLNDEVEIIEEDKIEKLNIYSEKNCKNNWKWKCNGYNISTPQKIMGDKINEIIDKLNKEV